MKLDWFVARYAFSENDSEAILGLVERHFNVKLDRQYEVKFLPHGWEEVAICVGYSLTTYKISSSGWVTWQWRLANTSAELARNTVYKRQIIIYGPKK